MDQSKFRAPRNTSQSNDLTGRHRPNLHCAGAIVDGGLRLLLPQRPARVQRRESPNHSPRPHPRRRH
eukprot:1273049-Lingulodinium_polyedra.AAC.1